MATIPSPENTALQDRAKLMTGLTWSALTRLDLSGKKERIGAAMLLLVLSAVASVAAQPPPDRPKSNPFARVKVLSASERGISIKHSRWGEEEAFRFADAHCAKFDKAALNIGSSPSGSSIISTWRCE